jgi:hypothetical protein
VPAVKRIIRAIIGNGPARTSNGRSKDYSDVPALRTARDPKSPAIIDAKTIPTVLAASTAVLSFAIILP